MQAFITGEPGKAPAWYLKTPSAATIVPSRLAPIFTVMAEPEVGDFHAEQLRGVRAHHEVPLARAPELALAVGVEARDASLRLDIALVHRRGLERHLYDFVGRREAGLRITDLVLDPLRDIRRRGRRRIDPA